MLADINDKPKKLQQSPIWAGHFQIRDKALVDPKKKSNSKKVDKLNDYLKETGN